MAAVCICFVFLWRPLLQKTIDLPKYARESETLRKAHSQRIRNEPNEVQYKTGRRTAKRLNGKKTPLKQEQEEQLSSV